MKRSTLSLTVAVVGLLAGGAAQAADCPEGGLRFGVEPYESAQRLLPVYTDLSKLIGDKLGCPVQLFIATSYNAEIEAMRNGKLEIGEFGPLGYVLAHQVAKAEAVATFADKDGKPSSYYASHRHLAGSGIDKLADVKGKTFAFSDPGLDLGPSVSGLRPEQERHRPGQRHQGDLRRQPHRLVRGAAQPQGLGRRAEQRGNRQRQAAQRV